MADACRDWLATLWPASYRGVAFQVETDSHEFGKRVEIHEYPNRDAWYAEELGQRARRHRLTAYLASDTIDAELTALVEVCTRAGSGTLVLPLIGARQAVCLTAKTERRKDRHGYVAVDLDFVEDPGLGAAPYPAPYYAGLISHAAETLLAVASATFEVALAANYESAGFSGVSGAGGPPDHVTAAIATEIATVAAVLEAERGTAALGSAKAAATAQVLIDLYAAAEPLSVGATATIGAAVGVSSIPTAFAAAVTAFQEAAAAGSGPAEAAGVLRRAAASLPVEATGSMAGAMSTTADLAVSQAGLTRRAGLTAIAAGFAEAVASWTFGTRREAIQARADAAALFEPIIAAATTAEEIEALTVTRNAVVEKVSRTIADLAPVLEVSSPRAMPSVWWAHRLYNDAGRAEELVVRNGVSHPSFMPATIEALAR